jgi:hypothetical protein
MSVLQRRYHVLELHLLNDDRGEIALSLHGGETESGPVEPEWREAHRWPVDVSSRGAVRRLLHVHYVALFVGVTNVRCYRFACE